MGNLIQVIRTLSKATQDIVSRLNELSYEELLAYLERRSDLFECIQKVAWSEDEKLQCQPFVQQILDCDPMLREKMISFQNEAASELQKIHSAQKQQSGYHQQAYYAQHHDSESLFFDQKK